VLIVLGAVLLGVVIGLALGGSFATLADARFRWWPLAIVGLCFQLIVVPGVKGQLDHWLSVGFLIASYVVLLVFVAVNVRRPGFALVAVGFALNLLVISLNGGMPVEASALRTAAGPRYPGALRRLVQTGGTKHHLAGPGDVLTPLSDDIGVGRPVRNVFSVGDLTAMAGVMWVLAMATKGPPGRRRRPRSRWRQAAPGLEVRPEKEPTPSVGEEAPTAPPGATWESPDRLPSVAPVEPVEAPRREPSFDPSPAQPG